MAYTPLREGDYRKERDEFRRTCSHNGYCNDREDPFLDWHPVILIGHEILKADLFVAEFRRPA